MLTTQIKSGKLSPVMTFSQKVWTLTARIPRGKVVRYADIARKLNSKGVRAVGGALHRNPFAPEVPCHRVVGTDGSLTGFAQGLPRKLKMLQKEGVAFNKNKVDLERSLHRL